MRTMFPKGGAINPTPVVHSNPVLVADARSALCDLYGVRYAYLRQSVVNRSMSVLRHRAVENKYAAALASEESNEQEIIILLECSALVAALRRLWASAEAR